MKRNLLTYLDGALVFSLYIGVVAQVAQWQGFLPILMISSDLFDIEDADQILFDVIVDDNMVLRKELVIS